MNQYEPHYYEFARERGRWAEFPRKEALEALLLNCKPGASVLEVGCGTGEVLAYLPPEIAYFGVERSEYALSEARAKWSGRKAIFETALASQLPFPDSMFDAALMVYVLEHLPDPKKALTEVGRVIKPGGILILAAPNLEFPLAFPNALRHISAGSRLVFHLKRFSDYFFRLFGAYAFRTLPSNYTTATGKYEKKDDDLAYVVSSYEVINFLKKSGWKLEAFWREKQLSGLRRIIAFFPALRWYGVPLAASFRK